jgi:uncharacterized protein YbcI
MTAAEGGQGTVLARVSNEVVAILSECYGRGPTKAKSYLNDNYLLTVTEDLLTTVEQTLVERGHQELVRAMRLRFQEVVADRFVSAIETATGRRVVTYHSQVTFDPAMGFEIFVLDSEDA